MSVVVQKCITCDSSGLSVEDLLRKAFVCDGEGNVYLRVFNPLSIEPFCADIDDYIITLIEINGVEHDGIEVIHGLGKTTAMFLTVQDAYGKSVIVNYLVIDANTIFLVLDGLTSGSFCLY